MAAHGRPNGTMNRSYADWAIDLRTPLYIHTIPGPIRVHWLNSGMPHRKQRPMKHVIHVLRSLRRYVSDNFRTKYRSVFLAPVFTSQRENEQNRTTNTRNVEEKKKHYLFYKHFEMIFFFNL